MKTNERYKQVLFYKYEIVSGVPATVEVNLTNTTPAPFPGGTLELVHEIRGGGESVLATSTPKGLDGSPITVPPILPGETKKVVEAVIMSPVPGLDWVRVSVQASDNVPIVLTKGRGDPGASTSEQVVAVLPRVEVEILLTLRERSLK